MGLDRTVLFRLATAAELLAAGHGVSVDLFGERVSDPSVADRVLDDYLELAGALPPTTSKVWLSVDLSHLAMAADGSGAAARLAAIVRASPIGRRVQVGAEEAALTDAIFGCVLQVASRGMADRLGATVQANLWRSPADVDALTDAGVHVRLVKGAYVETAGAHPYGEPTDIAFLRLGFRLADRGAAWSMATHDARLREALLLAHGPVAVEQLLGVRPEALPELRARGVPTPRLRPVRRRMVPVLDTPPGRVPRRLTSAAMTPRAATGSTTGGGSSAVLSGVLGAARRLPLGRGSGCGPGVRLTSRAWSRGAGSGGCRGG